MLNNLEDSVNEIILLRGLAEAEEEAIRDGSMLHIKDEDRCYYECPSCKAVQSVLHRACSNCLRVVY